MIPVLLLLAAPAPVVHTVETAELSLRMSGARIAHITNRLTGDTLTCPTAPALARQRRSDRSVQEPSRESPRRAGSGAQVDSVWSKARAATQFSPAASQTIRVSQKLQAEAGTAGISWSLAVPDSWEILIPGNSGQRFNASAPFVTRAFDYPIDWEAACVQVQGPKGGLLIYAADGVSLTRWLALEVEHRPGRFTLRFETRNQAPFTKLTTVTSADWRIRAYAGSWQQGAEIYRQHITRGLGLKRMDQRRPAWASQIRFTVIMGMDTPFLQRLAERVDATQTLLYIAGWRKDEYDRNYPDYTPNPQFIPFVQEAHRLGFRVMAHVNYFGCDPKHPLYERFAQYHMRDPFTGAHLWWDWTLADPPIKFAYINPASREWRQEFIRRMVALVAETGVDAFHLDQTLCIFNDQNGLIDGMTCMQGNVALHKELSEALPDVALSGEGLNEVTAIHEHFAQRHVWGYDHVQHTWNNDLLALSHPISSYLLRPHTTIYGYLGYVNPVSQPQAWLAWQRAYECFGVIPTWAWPTADQLDRPTPALAALLAETDAWQRLRLDPDCSTHWPADVRMQWRGQGGSAARVLAEGDGSALQIRDGADASWETLYRRIENASTWTGDGSIPGWRAWNGRTAFGLDPETRYLWSAAPWPDAPHFSALSGSLSPRELLVTPHLLTALADSYSAAQLPAGSIPLWRTPGTSGVTLRGASASPSDMVFLEHPSGAFVQPETQGLFMHPPWRHTPPSQSKPLELPGAGSVWVRWELPANPETLEFRAEVKLRQGAHESDGVLFRVKALDARGATLRQAVQMAESTVPQHLSLTLANLPAARHLQVEVWPGPKGNPSFDWAILTLPHLRPSASARVEGASATVAGAPADWRPLAASGPVAQEAGGTWALSGETPLFALFASPDTPIHSIPLDLIRTEPIAWVVTPEGEARSADGYSKPVTERVSIGGVERLARNAHPPAHGRTVHAWLVGANGQAARIRVLAGIRENTRTNGVLFRITANGRILAEQRVMPKDGWVRFDVALPDQATQWITLETDPMGNYDCDWAWWADAEITRRP